MKKNKIIVAITGASGAIYSKVLLDKLERVPEIPAPGYVSGDWLNEISPSSDLVEQDESSQTEYGLF